MEYQAAHTASVLNSSYTFQSVSGKNADFCGSITNMPFFFRTDTSHSRSCLCVHAGGEITYTVPAKYSHTSLPYTLLLFVTAGESTISCQNHTLTLTKDDILLFPADSALHFSTSRTPFSYAIFYLSGTVCNDYVPVLCSDQYFYHRKYSPNSILWQMLPSILSLLPQSTPSSTLHLSAMFHLLFSSLMDLHEKELSQADLPKHISQMKYILDSDYQNPHSLEELEQTLGVNKYRLCRDFSKHLGISPIQYLNQVRIKEATRLLRFTNLTIREVGSAVGIDNTTHFINLFKKNTGITPLQFRQTHIH